MTTTFSSYLKAPAPQPAHTSDWSPLVLPKKRSHAESYHNSYGESEETPTPKTRKARQSHSRPGVSFDPSSPNVHTTPPPTQEPRDSGLEDSGEESDDIYDQFDLGNFTKEEIKRYESMVGPGERLRDVASSEEPSGPAPETTSEPFEDPFGPSVTMMLSKGLQQMLRAGLSNAIERVNAEKLMPIYDIDEDGELCDMERVVDVFMDKLAKPAPQMEAFLRRSNLREDIYYDNDNLSSIYGPWITTKLAHRIFEQEVYDLGRSTGLSKGQATAHVIKVREESGKCNIDLAELGNYESSECEDILNYLKTYQEPEASPSVKEHEDLGHISEQGTKEIERLLAEKNSKGAKQVKRYLQTLKDNDLHFEYDGILLRLQFLDEEPIIDNISGLRAKIAEMEAANKKKKENATRKDAKKVRRAEAQKEKRKHDDHQQGMPREQKLSRISPEHQSQAQPIEDRNAPQKQKKKARKRNRIREVSVQSEEPSIGHHNHQKDKVGRDAQDAGFKEAKKRKVVGPQRSPFFQRNDNPNAKEKDTFSKAEQPMDFQPPMIQPPPTNSPSTPIKKRPPFTAVSPPSEDSSPLSSLRSTPSLISFGDREIESDNKRIIALSYTCPRSKPVASTRKPEHDTTGLPTPASSPISLRDLNKRLLEGTIYQDGIALVKPEAPATLPVSKKQRKRSLTVSHFFAKSLSKKPKASEKVSCIPFPPLQSISFGLVQERLSHDPFRLLIAVIFLNKTRGSVALPVFYELMKHYPTPADLAAANQEDVVDIIQHLGLQNQRAKKCINLAKAWLERPPEKGKRYRVLHYPKRHDGKDISLGDIIDEEDERVAWEIGQLPGVGVYAIDSWRIFCRDELRGLPTGLPMELTPEAKEEELRKEWTRVLAGDKELRAYLRWRWLRNGWEWDPVTGERKKADESELAKADKGGVIYEGDGGDMVVGAVNCEGLEAAKAEKEARNDGSGKENAIIADPKTRNAPEAKREKTNITHDSTPAPQQLVSATNDGKAPKNDAETSNQASP